ncbi:UV radiation resistance protein and autophagy-related subunit 14-domain-containing protein [Kockovaella imperatae]|uniref:Autophagy-related protein 14 n=1 Tax=Kockovaella imperatae TaxID=4999 RepID=A0A1Y1UEG8_9TREE|nr:UV radiation resistance protein and autophagy-related subunit 14-domain-containing protein [Kockovaella imperatae]ORX36443.1 UV radiation resistance protein and autophagy-related subunit 14-domain-containing protein [Kockovaella imperatae]
MSICPCCEIQQPAQYCSQCLREGVATHHRLSHSLRAQCASSIVTSSQILTEGSRSLDVWRRIRAEVALAERRVRRLVQKIQSIESELAGDVPDPFRVQRRHQKPTMTDRDVEARHQEIIQRQSDVDHRLVHARRVLVKEAVTVFGLQDGDIPSIAGLPVPLHYDLRKQPSFMMNAAISHVIHLLRMLSIYLSIALPFQPDYPKHFHVGRPIIRANLPFLQTSKYREAYPLWISSTAWKTDLKSRAKHRNFLQTFGLLAHSVSYLAWSQGVQGIGIPDDSIDSVQIPVTSLVRLLRTTADSPSLGHRAHEPGTAFLPHLGFGLDVSRVVAWTSVTESADDGEQTDEWDVVEA